MALDRFSIDDVRESFTADMAAKIRRVREAGQALIESSSLQTPVAQDPVDGIPGFDAVSHACHAIFGTSALVDARSMAESARLIEILTSVGKDTLLEMEKQARIGRSLGEACVEGASALQHMLELELDHRGLEAWEVALAFRERMGRWEEARDAIAKGEPPREFAFDDEQAGPRTEGSPGAKAPPSVHGEFSFEDEAPPSASSPPSARLAPWAASPLLEPGEFSFEDVAGAPPPPAAPDPLSAELLEVFRQEAREGLVLLEAHLRVLAGNPRERATLGALERIYHTLKGSAATVGLGRVSAMAADLQDTLQDALDRELDRAAGLSPEAIADLVTRTNSLLAAAELPAIEPAAAERPDLLATSRDLLTPPAAPGAPGAPAGVREAVAITVPPEIWETFLEESADILARMERQILGLEESPQPQAVLLELFRSYHTLKGSSHTVGLAPLGRVVHRVEDFLEELSSAPILPPLRHLATLLLNVQDDLRRGLRQAPEGFVETRLSEIEAEIASVRAGGPRSSEMKPRAAAPSSSGVLRSGAPSSGVIQLTPSASGAAASGPSGASPRRRFDDRALAEDRRSVRVTQERLDGLMNLTGELVVGRSRLLRRVSRLRG
ncbi:MAG TPA: Hpt domain-containing protein, partial [Vicinamibacteria bacterium]